MHDVWENIPRNNIKLAIGDFNAQIVEEEYNENVAGKATIHNWTNDNGLRLCNFGIFIISTKFRLKMSIK